MTARSGCAVGTLWSRQLTRLPRATAGHFRFASNLARECSTSWRRSLPPSSSAARLSPGTVTEDNGLPGRAIVRLLRRRGEGGFGWFVVGWECELWQRTAD